MSSTLIEDAILLSGGFMEACYIISVWFFIIGLILLIIDMLITDKKKVLNKRSKPNNICILIPARDESKVIEKLLYSIKASNYKVNMKDVYVIVESSKDKTCKICDDHGVSVFVRKKLNLKRKGYALMEVIEDLCNNKYYDMYFIFDADNYIDKDYIGKMVDAYTKGYDIGVGNRRSSNINTNWVSVCSALTFSLINTLANNRRKRSNRNIIVSGTGYYITKDLIKEWKTFPFTELTEDYELSLYSAIKEYKMTFVKDAIFYDEQPISFKESIIQRTRWVKGYFDCRKKYKKDLYIDLKNRSRFGEWIGLKGYILILISILFLSILELLNYISTFEDAYLNDILLFFLAVYLLLFIISLIMIILDKKNYDMSSKSCLRGVILNPLFLLSYLICLLRGLGNDVEWDKIEHYGISD